MGLAPPVVRAESTALQLREKLALSAGGGSISARRSRRWISSFRKFFRMPLRSDKNCDCSNHFPCELRPVELREEKIFQMAHILEPQRFRSKRYQPTKTSQNIEVLELIRCDQAVTQQTENEQNFIQRKRCFNIELHQLLPRVVAGSAGCLLSDDLHRN